MISVLRLLEKPPVWCGMSAASIWMTWRLDLKGVGVLNEFGAPASVRPHAVRLRYYAYAPGVSAPTAEDGAGLAECTTIAATVREITKFLDFLARPV